ncbi:signal peptidase I, partial [Candidatus Woesearchaeota archaeon]|nr:signal peptidase I [Candidatus Woesearchaeota archaeon]
MDKKQGEEKPAEKENKKIGWKKLLKKTWHFIWVEDSIWSWIVNVILAFVLIKFIVYPGLGLALGTQFPIVAVVSNSMEHGINDGSVCGKNVINYDASLDDYWEICGEWYEGKNISKKEFSSWKFKNGFNKGDIMILNGKKPADIEVGDVIVFTAKRIDIKREPIIHRVVGKSFKDGKYYFTTKGDWNPDTINDEVISEKDIAEERILGNALIRLPFLGYV